jgi:hypothetical protein
MKDKCDAIGGNVAAARQHHNEHRGSGRGAPASETLQSLHGEGPFGRTAFLSERRVKPWGSSKTWPFCFERLGKIDHVPHRRFLTESVLKTSRFCYPAWSGERGGRICRGLAQRNSQLSAAGRLG